MKKIIDFLFEASSLKRFPRLGYNLLGEKGESVGDHIYGSLVIGYVLAKLEKANVERVKKQSEKNLHR